jgi:rod shape determining protein RodA
MEQTSGRLRTGTDPVLLTAMVLLISAGVLLIFSATHQHDSDWMRLMYRTQIVWALIGFVAMYAVIITPARIFYDFAYIFYFLTLCLLVFVLVKGSAVGGATRWLGLGPVRIQPSEFAKIATLFALARYLSSRDLSLEKITGLIAPFLIIAVPMGLILKQPDLSTALVFGSIFLPMLFWSGLSLVEVFFILSPLFSLVLAFNIYLWALFFIILFIMLIKNSKYIALSASILGLNFAIGIVLPMVWERLHDYQKMRILSFLDPKLDPSGAGYQVIQSLVAIGSGKFLGKGFLQGTQTRLSFLPEQHTDFIFSVLGEQFGFAGCLAVMVLFTVLIVRLFSLAGESSNRFINLVIVGFGCQLLFHIITNLAMTVGFMPVTGLPLPFLSYGGSFLIACMALMGFVMSVTKKSAEY